MDPVLDPMFTEIEMEAKYAWYFNGIMPICLGPVCGYLSEENLQVMAQHDLEMEKSDRIYFFITVRSTCDV